MKVFQIVVVASLVVEGAALMGKCDFTQDCDVDSECAAGLWCTDAHKQELKNAGFNERYADCGSTGVTEKYWELCFDPSILPVPKPQVPTTREALNGGGFGGNKTPEHVSIDIPQNFWTY
jgi:hypothetical protein